MSHSDALNAPTGSPEFRKPPVAETSMAVQFAALDAFRIVHHGLFYECVRDEFPAVSEHSQLPRLEVRPFGPHDARPSVMFSEEPPGLRLWYADRDGGTSLVQLQPDRMAFNWRDRPDDPGYPRYRHNRLRFHDIFGRFCAFAHNEGVGEVRPDLAEVLYVNRINKRDGESWSAAFTRVFAGFDSDTPRGFLPPPGILTLNRVYPIDGDRGRLFTEASCAYDANGDAFILLKMTARVKHDERQDIFESLDTAHAWVVSGFVDITRESVRAEEWEQVS